MTAMLPIVLPNVEPLALRAVDPVALTFGGTPWWRTPAYSVPAFEGGNLSAGLAADFRRRRYALPMGMTTAQILAATPAEIGAAMRACTFSDVFEFSRDSTAIGMVDGQFVTSPANQPRLEDGGLLLEVSTINKVSCQKSNPTVLTNVSKGGDANATLTLVNDAAELTAAGLSSVCTNGMVYKLDNSAGTGGAWVTIGGQTGNTNLHALSAYIRGGMGRVVLGGAPDGINFGVSPQYRRVAGSLLSDNTSRLFAITVFAGQVVYFILPQLEEGAFATSVIPGNTLSTTTRAADNCKLTPRAAAVLQRTSTGLLVQGGRLMRPVTTTYAPIIGGAGGFRICGMSGVGQPVVGNSALLGIGGAVSQPWPDFGFAVGWDAGGKAGAIYGQFAADAVQMDANRENIHLGRSTTFTNLSGYFHQLVAWPARPANVALQSKAVAYV